MIEEQSVRSADNSQNEVALLVIDVQQGLFERSTPIYKAEQVLENINTLIHKARRAGIEVFFIQHANKSTLVKGSDAWQLHPKIQPLDTESVIHKRHGNALEETDLQERLGFRGVKNLVITGLVTQGCIKATSAGALEQGYGVILVEDGHSSFSKQAAELIVKWNQKLSEMGAELRRASQVNFGNNG
jgi:nicotinamidase-related amidase